MIMPVTRKGVVTSVYLPCVLLVLAIALITLAVLSVVLAVLGVVDALHELRHLVG
jgi:hypothetical protein